MNGQKTHLPEGLTGSRPVFLCLACGFWLTVALMAAGGCLSRDRSRLPLRPDPKRLAAAPPELRTRLVQDSFVYFRFVNAEWARRVCAAFQEDLASAPVIVHGDPHIEQYAVTATSHGLDDFDDAAHGPSVIDIVRFLGSLDVIARERGWTARRDHLFDRFFDGYFRALSDPSYVPPLPAVAKRVRERPDRTGDEFLAWSESLTQPLAPDQFPTVRSSLELVEIMLRSTSRPELPAGYLNLKKAGVLRMGIGSALARKFLARVEGPTASPADDVLIEAKELSRLEGIPCLLVPTSGEAVRVIAAAQQIGRIRHEILVRVPRRQDEGPEVREWWVRSWDRTYKEVTVHDLESAEELAELSHDAGAQLGATNLLDRPPVRQEQDREAELQAVRRLEPRIRATARLLTDALLTGWQELRRPERR